MTSLFKRLDLEEAVLRSESGALWEKLTAVDERLARLVITRETLVSLVGTDYVEQDREADQPTDDGTARRGPDRGPRDSPPGNPETPISEPTSTGPLAREVTRERALVLLAGAGRATEPVNVIKAGRSFYPCAGFV